MTQNANCEQDGTDFLLSLLDKSDKFSQFKSNIDPRAEEPHNIENELGLKKISEYVQHIQEQSNAYITGFIYKKFLKKNNCAVCDDYFLSKTNESANELISFKEYEGASLQYPSGQFRSLVKALRTRMSDLILKNIYVENIVNTLRHIFIDDEFYGLCDIHYQNNQYIILNSVIHITLKYLLTTINRKMNFKDNRPNSTIDKYLKKFGPPKMRKKN